VQREDITLPIGTVIRDDHDACYVIEEVLGTGGFSAVYKVRDRRTQRLYAMKELINPGREDKRKITVEADLLMRLQHPSLPRVYSTFEQPSLKRLYLLMDYIEGKTLEMLRQEQPEKRFPLAFVLSVIEPVVNAIGYLHAQQPPVVHRDIKPSNIIVPNNAAGALLVDFGLAKEHVDDNTTSVFRYGTSG
jgi:serine/threonine protein kinase